IYRILCVLYFLLEDSLTKKVEVQWVQSVVLPCQYSQPLEEMVTVKWRRLDLNPDIVHQRREGDDLESQNELFKGRTSMRPDAFDSSDFSLTLSELQLSDSGNYTCNKAVLVFLLNPEYTQFGLSSTFYRSLWGFP
uniref:Ig-like domain-containing protein n=1 Tax=Poecilia mexicana TaxID=48701 RepID=A0A3B3XVM5_9TELE